MMDSALEPPPAHPLCRTGEFLLLIKLESVKMMDGDLHQMEIMITLLKILLLLLR